MSRFLGRAKAKEKYELHQTKVDNDHLVRNDVIQIVILGAITPKP